MVSEAPLAATTLHASQRDAFILIELDDPSGFPRLTRIVLEEFHRLLDEAKQIPAARAIVITGTPKCFAAGAEIGEVAALSALEALRFSALGQELMRRIEGHPMPCIAAIRGHCLGGGLDLALACRLRVASSDAVFGHPGAGLGIITGWGGTQRLPRLLGPGACSRAMEMLATGRSIPAGQAYAWGLVNRVVPSERVVEAAMAVVRKPSPDLASRT